MSKRLPWTKLQDFYLRLGFLKVLVATLSGERRSATNDALVRQLERPTFESAGVRSTVTAAPEPSQEATRPPKGRKSAEKGTLTNVEMLVGQPAVPSALYGVTKKTAYKIIDWGRDIEFVGRANQISERALILRGLLPAQSVQKYLAGDVSAWNPFTLTTAERLFFLYHLLEKDVVTVRLIEHLSEWPVDQVIEARQAASMTCAAMFAMLEETAKLHDASSIREHRVALELALTMADEVGAPVPTHWVRQAAQGRAAREAKTAMRRHTSSRTSRDGGRKTTKNSDHQTIPRFEQLVDLGFLRKPDAELDDAELSLAARRRWRYVPTEACRRWSTALRKVASTQGEGFQRSSFSAVAVEALGTAPPSAVSHLSTEDVGYWLWSAYTAIGRPVGLTPVDSIALRAMIDAASAGVVLEMNAVHRLLLIIKNSGLMTECALFAAGATLETMFVRLKPMFRERLATVSPTIQGEWNK